MATSNKYLVLYMFSLFITAIPFSAVGPLIPFMASELGINETEYSVLFAMISASTFIAAIVYKILGKYRCLPKYHTILIISCLEMVVFSVAFTFMSTKNTQCIMIAIIKFFNYIFVVSTNICLMMAPSKQQIGVWMSFSHSTYGFGSLAGSILVGFLQEKIFLFVAAACLIVVPFFYFITSPEDIERTVEEQEEHSKFKEGSFKSEILISVGLFILVGIDATVQGWIPTYAVQTHVSTKQQAVQFTTIFWILQSIFRIVFAYVKKSDSRMLTISSWGQLAAGIICTTLTILHLTIQATYLCSILYGIALCMIFPLLLSISHEFGLYFTGDQISNMMISVTISIGVYSTITGELMKITPDMYQYSILAYSIIFLLVFIAIMSVLREESSLELKQKGAELPQAEAFQ